MQLSRSDDMRTYSILRRIYERINDPYDDLKNIITPEDGIYLDDLDRRLRSFDVTLLNKDNFHIYTDVVGKYILIKDMQREIIRAMNAIEGRE